MKRMILTTLATALLLASASALAQTSPATAATQPKTQAAGAMPAKSAANTSAPMAATKTASVLSAQFTTAISKHEPTDDVSSLDNSHNRIFFFTVLKDAAGQIITHRWQYNGKTMAEVYLHPHANHWRTWSSKKLMPNQTGTWSVQVVDSSGKVLLSKSFDYTKAAAMNPEATHKVPAAPTAPASATTKTLPPS